MEWFGYNEGDLLLLGDWGPLSISVLVLLGVAVVGLSWYDLRDMARSRRLTLIGLRVAVYMLAVMMLLEPALELKNVTKIKNHVAVLVDTSRSQVLKVDEAGTTRLARAGDWAREDAIAELLTKPNEDHVFDLFAFDSELRASTHGELANPALTAEGDATRILEAMEEAVSRIGRRDLGGFVLVTDGIDSGQLGGRVRKGQQLDETTGTFLTRLGVPVHVLATADSDGLKDLSVERVLYDDFAFVRNKVSMDVVLRVVGFEPARIPVNLYREGALLATREVEVGPDATEYQVSFELVPQQIGKEIYTISTPAYTGEALEENNRKDVVLKVIRDKIRALQVVGRPSWDERFLRQLLKRNPNVDLISFFILRTGENPQTAPESEMSLIPFPTRELFEDELGSFDIIIFQNFNYGPFGMERYLPQVAKYVRDGGGFVMIGGELSFTSGGYWGTPLEDVLPFVLAPSGPREALIDERPFVMDVTDAGARHPITQLSFDPVQNREKWGKLPVLDGVNAVLGPKPGATVLGTHPSLTIAGKPAPVVGVWEVGKGRSMAVATDSTWKWSFHNTGIGGTSRPYQTFWNASIRWLIKDPELKLLRVQVEESAVRPGEDVAVQVSVARPDYTPAVGVEGAMEILHRPLAALDGSSPELAPQLMKTEVFKTDDRGRAQIVIPAADPGAYTVRARAHTEAGDLEDEDLFLVHLDSQELRSIEPRAELLEAIAQKTGGSYHRLPDFASSMTFKEPRVVQVNRRKVIDLWDTLWVLVIICGLLGTEWTLRRRWGRL